MTLFSGQSVLVTGAAAGIGRSVALAFAAEGARLLLSDVDEPGGRETAEMIEAKGGEGRFVRADIAVPDDVDALVKAAVDAYGRLDCACNNAGIEGAIAPLAEQDLADYDRVMVVNARGTFLCLKAEIAAMLRTGGGAIVNIASVAGLVGFPGLSPYVASKHAINGLTKNAALEYGAHNIRINAICPGGIDTRMLDSVAEQASGGAQSSQEMLGPLHPIGRIGKPEEVANLAVWLCSPRASFLTGASIPVDGGFVAR